MKVQLKIRYNSAFFTPAKIVLADNEPLEIELIDRGRVAEPNKAVLLVGDTVNAFVNGKCTIDNALVGDIFVTELQERTASDKIVSRWTCENLYRLPTVRGYEDNRLVTERTFYKEVIRQLTDELKRTADRLAVVEQRLEVGEKDVKDLQNGKFTILKFKGENRK